MALQTGPSSQSYLKTFKPIWGAATAAHQVEGGNQWNDWWVWEQAQKTSEPSGIACDHYHLFREDFKLARSLGHTAHRFSIEWSRLEPAEGQWNEEAFRHYDEVFDALEAVGLEPVVTLHHFTNPQWFANLGGWLHPDADKKFAAYVKKVVERFGERAKFWITINEPLIFIYQGYLIGRWPPGEKSWAKCFQVMRQMIRAHIKAYQMLHSFTKNSECWVSIAHHMIAFSPCRKGSLLDRWIVSLREGFLNRLIFESLLSGFLFYPGIFCEKLPAKKTLDFLALNYYTRDFIRAGGWSGLNQFGLVCPKDHHDTKAFNDMGWEIHPEGIYQVVNSLNRYHLPIMITENGICTSDDRVRQAFIKNHVKELERAKNLGVPIGGYFYWSLVDNFEWAEGFKRRFGIVEVDYPTQRRIVRESAKALKQSCEMLFREEKDASRVI